MILPSNWTETRLGELATDVTYGYTAKSSSEALGPHMLRITDIQDDHVDWSTVPYCEISDVELRKYKLERGDLLFARTGATVGKSFLIIDQIPESVYASYLIRVRCRDYDLSRYLRYFFRSPMYWSQITDFSAGIGQPNVNGSKLKQLKIPLAPPAEQKRIADKLDRLLVAVDSCKARLDGVPAILKRFRQSVLAAATSGELTEEWRQGKELEAARDLVLEAIEVRKCRYRSDLAHSHDVGSRRPPKPSGIELREVEGGSLPPSWIWTVPENLCDKIVDGTHHTPNYVEEGVPFLSAKNIHGFEVHFDDCKFITAAEHDELRRRCQVVKGSLLVTKSGTIGRVAVVETEGEFSLFESVAVLTPSTPRVSSHYLGYVIAHYCMQGDQQSLIKGTAVRHLHLEDLRLLRIPLPSFAEQHEIVDRVQTLFRAADEIERKVDASRALLDRVAQGLFAKAFSGQLSQKCGDGDRGGACVVDRMIA